ncbi:MAG: GntR family transcriptional regulator [Spirochaetota bacterium]|nr:MAG: GntR family transcriptional regulator [Spirochaetota bacterium]
MNNNQQFKPIGLVDQISEWLTNAILDGTIKEGDRLIETRLQELFGVSRSPIREAFRELNKMGLVVIKPRIGTFVKRITRNDIEEQFPIRAVLEGIAARLAFERMKDGELDKIEKTFKKMKEAAEGNDIKGYWKYHHIFHDQLIDVSKNSMLIDILQQIRIQHLMFKVASLYYKEDLQGSFELHRKMLVLLKDRKTDPRYVEDFVRNHIEKARPRFLQYIDEDLF